MEFHGLSRELRRRLEDEGLRADDVHEVVVRTLREDLAGGDDVTSRACIDPRQRSRASFVARGRGRIAGLDVAHAVLEIVCGAENLSFEVERPDASAVDVGDVLARVVASTQGILVGERTALNLMCHLSGVASATARWVEAVAGTGAVIRDTRKTTPGLRALEKYAVRCGGGANHRMSLSDAVLIKDNHVAAAGGVSAAFARVRQVAGALPVEIEVDTIDQLREALDAGADLVLLDNMDPPTMRDAVDVAHRHELATGRSVQLEASGGLSLERAREVAQTGVHFISVGALTHSSPILDIGLDFEDAAPLA